MTIISSRARENRRDRRREIEMTLEYDGRYYPVADCSLGGVSIEGGCRTFPANTDVIVSLRTPRDEAPSCAGISLRVVRNDPRAERVAFHFTRLDDVCFTTLERHLTGRARH
jgi:hypothetical protein